VVGKLRLLLSLLVVSSLALAAPLSPAQAQESERADDAFFVKFGAGFSDYTGDMPIQNTGQPFDFQEFIGNRGSGPPILVDAELGYEFTSNWALALGFQAGNYPIVGYSTGNGSIEDSYRYTPQLLGRYTFAGDNRTVAPYIDAGANLTFGGEGIASTGYGPTAGIGLDIALDRSNSFYIESRYNLTFPDDAIDGVEGSATDFASFDMANQLLGFGVKHNFSTATPPRVVAMDGPTTVQAGESATFTAQVNEEEATRPLTYQWDFGDGSSGTGRTVSHTYDQPGTYDASFTARNRAGESSQSMTVEVTPRLQPASIASIDATPNPADTDEVVGRFQLSTSADAERAIEAASAAQQGWADTPAPERGRILHRAGDLLADRKEETVRALAREEGKTRSEADGEVQRTIDIFHYYAQKAREFRGTVKASSSPDTNLYTVQEPVGVVSLITPWNFPIAIPTWKLAPAPEFMPLIMPWGNTNVSWSVPERINRNFLKLPTWCLVPLPSR